MIIQCVLQPNVQLKNASTAQYWLAQHVQALRVHACNALFCTAASDVLGRANG